MSRVKCLIRQSVSFFRGCVVIRSDANEQFSTRVLVRVPKRVLEYWLIPEVL